jgi:uncharacterized protein (TIGR02145 family)
LSNVATTGSYNDLSNTPTLHSVATSGNYNELVNTPNLFDGTWSSLSGKPALSDVATSGSYNDLSNTPALHSVATSGNYNELVNKPNLFDGTWSSLSGKPALSDVATSGSYNDLSNTPALHSVAASGNYNELVNKPTTITTAQANAIDANTSKRSYPLADETKLAGIEAGAQVNVKADWNALTGDAQILNKPAFANVAISGDFEDLTNIPSFSTVAFSGDYNDLLNKPAGFDGAWESISGKPAFANVATTGDFEDLLNIPSFSNMAFSNNYNDLENKPSLFDGTWNSLSGKPVFSGVATSGSYNDLSNTPALHSVATSGNYNELVNKPALFDGTWASLSGKPSLSTVATSGSYNDLLNTPSLHSVAASGNYNELVNRPTLAVVASTGSYNDLSNKPFVFSGSFNDLSNKPTTLAGYGITNAMTTSHTANSITSTQVNNWNTAYTWGNHAGLYRSSTWVPTWTQVTGKPTFAAVATSGNYNDLSNRPNLSTYATKNMENQNITNLANPVNAQDASTKAYVDLLESRVAQMEEVLLGAGLLTVKDGDGNEYGVVEIGGQYWLDQNLKTTKLNDGTPIANVPNVNTFIWTMTPAFAWYNNNIANKETYGALYNYYVVETGKVCPAGWHVPTMADWDALVAYLGGVHVTGGKLKEIGTSTWLSPNTGATNSSGFTARPGGMRFSGSGSDLDLGYSAFLWSTEANPIYPSEVYTREMGYFKSRLDKFSVNKNTGASIRCVKD